MNNNENVVHQTDTFRVVLHSYTLDDGSLVNWEVKHNVYNTIEAEYQCLVDALRVCELLQKAIDTKSYMQQSDIDRIIENIKDGNARILSFPPKSVPSDEVDDDDEDPTSN